MVNSKHAFWIALVLASFVFFLGLFFGLLFEQSRLTQVNNLFYKSEFSLIDMLTQASLLDASKIDCSVLIQNNIDTAENIYNEARLLEVYASKSKLSVEEFNLAHQRYDLLRTLLWLQAMRMKSRCDNEPIHIVYFYSYKTENLNQRALQSVWSKILLDVKEKYGADVLLIPIATDTNVSALQPLLATYYINQTPAILVDERVLITSLESSQDIERILHISNATR